MNSATNWWKPPAAVVVALVCLRLAIGWHFHREGTKKLTVDPTTHGVSINFSAEAVLKQAVGPLATFFHNQAPGFHSWERLLANPAASQPLSDADVGRLVKWKAEYAAKQNAARQAKEPPVFELPPVGPYTAWAKKVDADWLETAQRFAAVPGVTDEQRKSATAALQLRRQQLAAYLELEAPAITDWQHELWRLREWQNKPEAAAVPFEEARIAEKRAETTATGLGWVQQVRGIERGLRSDLRGTLTPEQLEDADFMERVDAALADPAEVRMERINRLVTFVVTGVGVLLLLGLFTRLACVAGALFLLSVIAMQPPWVPGAIITVFYYQLVEIAGFFVLFATAAGRSAGLDFFIHALVGRRD